MDLTRDGNDRAFEAIVERYRKPLLRYCSRLLPASRAEDAVQQAFLSAYSSIRSGEAELRLRPWLYRIAHNAALNLLRQNGWNHEQVSEEIDGVETPPQAFARNERLRSVMTAVRELPDRQRDAIVLQAVQGHSYDEIASELGVTGGAVRQLLNRARNTLRAGVGALIPNAWVVRLAADTDGGAVERIGQAAAGAGGLAGLTKIGAALVVAGAVVGGATHGVIPGISAKHSPQSVAAAATPGGAALAARPADRHAGGTLAAAPVSFHRGTSSSRGSSRGGAAGQPHHGSARHHGSGGDGSSGGDNGGGTSGSDHSGRIDGHGGSSSGSGDGGGHSSSDGSGRSGDGGHSGSGSGGDGATTTGSSGGSGGSGSGDGGGGVSSLMSGSPSGSGSSGSGSDGSGGHGGSSKPSGPDDTTPSG